jgi:hypothetical protein
VTKTPPRDRVDRIVRSGLHQAEQAPTERIAGRLPAGVRARLLALVQVPDANVDEADPSVLALIKAATGNVSLSSMLTEVSRLEAVRALGLPVGLFADVPPKVLAGWRARAAVGSPSHLRGHGDELTVTLLAALMHCRTWEITDALVTLLLRTVHAIEARADRRTTKQLVAEFKWVQARRTCCSGSLRPRPRGRTTRCGRWCSRSSARTTCATWSRSTRRPGRRTGAPCRRLVGRRTPTTTARA